MAIVPNKKRIIVRRIDESQLPQKGLIISGNVKVGESLLAGVVINPGDSDFKKGMIVFFSEYSASNVADFAKLARGEASRGDLQKPINQFTVVPADDVMCWETDNVKLDDLTDQTPTASDIPILSMKEAEEKRTQPSGKPKPQIVVPGKK